MPSHRDDHSDLDHLVDLGLGQVLRGPSSEFAGRTGTPGYFPSVSAKEVACLAVPGTLPGSAPDSLINTGVRKPAQERSSADSILIGQRELFCSDFAHG